jgi:hypothetical protein
MVSRFLEMGYNPNSFDEHGQMPLHNACGRVDIIDILLSGCANVNMTSRISRPAFWDAIDQRERRRFLHCITRGQLSITLRTGDTLSFTGLLSMLVMRSCLYSWAWTPEDRAKKERPEGKCLFESVQILISSFKIRFRPF